MFTVTVLDLAQDLARRTYSSHQADYPVSGTKPMTHDGWHDHCITRQQIFVANTTPEFAKYFFDHALISSLGLGSVINIPIVSKAEVVGTVNILAEEHHFTAARQQIYQDLARTYHAELVRAMQPSRLENKA